MDKIVHVLLEYIEVLVHNILYVSNIYPKSIFERRVKYDLPVRYLIHPEVNDYVSQCLLSIKELLIMETLNRVDVVFFNESKKEEVFSFTIDYNYTKATRPADPYMIKLEQSLRSHFLKVMNLCSKVEYLSENSSFKILMHTDELSSINLLKNSALEKFPWIECETRDEVPTVLPISSLDVENVQIQTFIKVRDVDRNDTN